MQVIVYEDVADLRKDAARWRPKPESHDGAVGVTHCIERRTVLPNGTELRHASAGIIRLWVGSLSTVVVAHEATHMACGIYRQDHNGNDPMADMEDEEVLAYLVGDLTAALTNGLHRHGLWK